MERMLRKQINGFLELSEKMDPNDHGSRAKRSCLSQLLEHHLEILDMLERGENVDLVYLDFAKAFDKCDINLLLHKAKALGITGKLGRWIHSFLSQRKQNVVVNGTKSNDSNVISGVPQGTVLGPLLFLIYIADIGDKVKASIKVYVDDTKLTKSVKTESDVENLQDDLEELYLWASENNMKFNGSKFQLMRYGTNENIKEDTIYFTEDMSEVIDQSESVKDLGVIMNNKANFNDQVQKALKKARQKMGWILRTFNSRNKWFMRQMFKSLVIPHIDYCSQLWMPVDGAGIHSLEKLQFDFFKKIPELRGLNYWEGLKSMKMLSMQRRLERYRIIYAWKILENLAPNCGIEKVHDSEDSRIGRRLRVSIPKGSSRINKLKEQLFQLNGSKLFNCLPNNIRNQTRNTRLEYLHCPGPDDFKTKLDNFLEIIPDQPRIDGMSPGVETNSLIHQTKRGQRGGLLLNSGA